MITIAYENSKSLGRRLRREVRRNRRRHDYRAGVMASLLLAS